MKLTEKDIGKKFRMRAWDAEYPDTFFEVTAISPRGTLAIGNLSDGSEQALKASPENYWTEWLPFEERNK